MIAIHTGIRAANKSVAGIVFVQHKSTCLREHALMGPVPAISGSVPAMITLNFLAKKDSNMTNALSPNLGKR